MGWPAENSLAAFARAVQEGADGVELDVRITACGVPVVLHDSTLARATDGRDARAVHRLAYQDLPRLAGGERIPTLTDALDALRGRIVNVEIKSDVTPTSLLGDVAHRLRLVRAAARAVKAAESAHVVFSSFDPLVVVALAALSPRVPRAILVGMRPAGVATALPLAMRPAIGAVHLEHSLWTAPRAERLARSGLRLTAWTVNDPDRAVALVALGVTCIITDTPAAVVSGLADRATNRRPP